ncbi:hypothetical protein PV327_002818 [Microctonus hyperodae]|uniref:Reverse transcriptase domain-containing protein n=1 Tax=Microctonus hyperodae TaxID=165561 RepID=A0AA39FGC5_MICHY|nr:hypothetical protein PV327_002818 [Microctonus hyperodae]
MFKLIQMKFPSKLLYLIHDMIHGKNFYIKHDNITSGKRTIKEGLQQGTINSPLLFSLYTNSILELYNINSNNNTYAIAYADDVIVYVAADHIKEIEDKLNDLVNKLNNLYLTWNLKLNPGKCETILFRNPRVYMSTKKAEGINTFKITTTIPGTNTPIDIPTKKSVVYLGYTIDNLVRGTAHIDLQLQKARNAQFSLSRLINNNNIISKKAKIICYMIFIRSLLIYAAPIWWNLGAACMERLRCFERTCLRSALNMYNSSKSNFKHKISNKILYNAANIPRIDNFIIKITRDYYANLKKINNDEIQKFSKPDELTVESAASRGCVSPQDFIYHDQLGIIQDEHNTPILYHWSRHKANKRIPSAGEITNNLNKHKYSKTIPDIDIKDRSRLGDKYWWLNSRLEIIKRLSARFKKQGA